MTSIGRLLFAIPASEANFARRGFDTSNETARLILEAAGTAFLFGYNTALGTRPRRLAAALSPVPNEQRGFAFEGAAMALQLLDIVTPWRRDRLRLFLSGDAAAHLYMAHVGAGWALARSRTRLAPILRRADPLLRWLMIDGYGFHQGYFYPWEGDRGRARLAPLGAGAERVFDQGLGRSLWFVHCTDPRRLAAAVEARDPARHADLWSGVGLAAAYAGPALEPDLRRLVAAAGTSTDDLGQGAAFAAEARRLAGNDAAHTDAACRLLSGVPAHAAAALTELARHRLPRDGRPETYLAWRAAIRRLLAPQRSAA